MLPCLVPACTAVVVARQRRVAIPVVERVAAEPTAPSAGNSDAPVRRTRCEWRRPTHRPPRPRPCWPDCGRRRAAGSRRHLSSISLSLASVLTISVKTPMRSAEPSAERLGGGPTHLRLGVVEQVQRVGEGEHRLPSTLKRSSAEGLIEQPDPGAGAGHRLLVQQLLELIGELVRPIHRGFRESMAHNAAPPDRRAGVSTIASSRLLSSSVKNSVSVEISLQRSCMSCRNRPRSRRAHVGREEQLREAHYPVQAIEDRSRIGRLRPPVPRRTARPAGRHRPRETPPPPVAPSPGRRSAPDRRVRHRDRRDPRQQRRPSPRPLLAWATAAPACTHPLFLLFPPPHIKQRPCPQQQARPVRHTMRKRAKAMADDDWPNLVTMFFRQADRFGERPLLWHKREGRYVPLTWREVAVKICMLARGLRTLGISPGERVVLVAENRPAWMVADLGDHGDRRRHRSGVYDQHRSRPSAHPRQQRRCGGDRLDAQARAAHSARCDCAARTSASSSPSTNSACDQQPDFEVLTCGAR